MKPIEINLRGGMIKQYRNRGNVKVSLLKADASLDLSRASIIATDETAKPDSSVYSISLRPKQPGIHIVTINDGNDLTEDQWLNYNKVFKSDGYFVGTFYCYIPKGQNELSFFGNNIRRGKLLDANGKVLLQFDNHKGDQSVTILPDSQGKMVCFSNVAGDIKLLNVPPYFSVSPTETLLPKYLVIKDSLNH